MNIIDISPYIWKQFDGLWSHNDNCLCLLTEDLEDKKNHHLRYISRSLNKCNSYEMISQKNFMCALNT